MLALFSGCGHWAVERQDSETAERIDANLRIGMSMAEFRGLFPDAESMGENTYFVSVQEVCFWCYSSRGFRESNQVFARSVTFENNSLVSIDPLSVGVPK